MVSERIQRWLLAAAPPVVALAVVLAVEWPGLQPGVAWWDTGEFQTIAPVLGTGHSPGFPTYVLIGWVANLLLTPLGEPAFRMNVFSLLCLGAAAAFLSVIVRRLGVPAVIAVVAAFGMATTAVVWLQSTRAEPHTLHLAFVGLLFALLVAWGHRRRLELGRTPDGSESGPGAEPVTEPATEPVTAADARTPDSRRSDRWLVAAAFVFGLSAGNHGLTFLLAPPILLYVLAVDARTVLRPRLVAACALASVGTLAAVYLELPLRAGPFRAPLVYGTPDTWDGFWYVALATQFHGLIGHPFAELPQKIGDLIDLTAQQFGIIAILVPVGFLATVRLAPRYALLSGTAMAITLFWNSFFNDGYIDRYYIGPVFWAWTWLAILGAFVVVSVRELLESARPSLRGRVGPASPAAIATAVIVAGVLLFPRVTGLGARAATADRHADTSAQTWLNEVLPVLAPNAVVVSWWSTSTPLWYAQNVDGERPDIFIADDRTMLDLDLGRAPDVIDACLAANRPTYAIRLSNGLAELMRRFDMRLVAAGGDVGVYEVQGLLPGAAPGKGPNRCPGTP